MKLSEIIKSNNTVIHCVTENEAKELCGEFHRLELKWVDGDSYIEYTEYDKFGECTCYYPKIGLYGDTIFYESQLFTIIPFSEVEFDGANKTKDQTVGIEIKQENICKKQIDWEQRRYEIAKDVLTSIVSKSDGRLDKRDERNLITKSLNYADRLIYCLSEEVDKKTTINRYPEIERILQLPEDRVVIDFKWGYIIDDHRKCKGDQYIVVQRYSYERLQRQLNGDL